MIMPSKKVLSVFVLTASLTLFVILVFGKKSDSGLVGNPDSLRAGNMITIPSNSNWQEDLNLLSSKNIDLAQADSIPNRNTATEALTINLMSNYLTLKQGDALTEQSALNLVDESLGFIETVIPQNKSYSRNDLNIVKDNGLQSIKQYGENLGLILKTNRPTTAKNELEIISKTIETNNPAKINELDPIIFTYQNLTQMILKMPVPETFVLAHIDILNGLNSTTISLKESKRVLVDPIVGMTSLKLYNEGLTNFATAMSATVEFIKSNKVNYEQGSGGYFLLHGI